MASPYKKQHEPDRFDARLLFNFMDPEMDNSEVAQALGTSRDVITKWKQGVNNMIPWWRADHYAIHLGTHPGLVWGDEWWDKALASA